MERVEYIKPSIEIVKIYSPTILAGSDPKSIVTDPNGVTVTEGIDYGGTGDGNDFK